MTTRTPLITLLVFLFGVSLSIDPSPEAVEQTRPSMSMLMRPSPCRPNCYSSCQPEHLMPWFKVPGRKSENMKIIFGHWSTLGYYHGHNCYAIDTGCLWGGELTAIKLGKNVKRISIDCPGSQKPS